MTADKRGEMDLPFIHFRDPPEHPSPAETYYNFRDAYNANSNHNTNRINDNEMKYIVKRHARKC